MLVNEEHFGCLWLCQCDQPATTARTLKLSNSCDNKIRTTHFGITLIVLMKSFVTFWMVSIVIADYTIAQDQQSFSQVSELTLRPHITVQHPTVTLRDVLTRDHSSSDLSLLDLDLYEFSEDASAVELTRQFISLRVALSESSHHISLSGADSILVEYVPSLPLTDIAIENQAALSLSRHLQKPSSEVQVRLLQPVMAFVQLSRSPQHGYRFDFLWPPDVTPGRQNVVFRVFDGEQLVVTRQLPVAVMQRIQTIKMQQYAPRGTQITAEMISTENAFTASNDPQLTLSSVIGRTLGRSLRPHATLSPSDLEPLNNSSHSPVIQARSAVRIVARKNGLEVVVPRAQALQSGQQGQLIQVKNLQSNRVITGRVVNASEVVVDLQ